MKRYSQPVKGTRLRGVTLSEVLISTFIMSIGVVSLATLFPISLIQAIQATQATNATLLKQNASSLIDAVPALVHDPNRNNNFVEHFGTNYLVDPLGRAAGLGPLGFLNRYSGLVAATPSFEAAEQLAILPDSWTTVLETDGVLDAADFRVVLPTSIDVSGITPRRPSDPTNPPRPVYRALLFEPLQGRSAVIQNIYTVDSANHALSWRDNVDPPPLPYWFAPAGNRVKVKVELRDRRYSWLATVRKNRPGTLSIDSDPRVASVDVVTFFNRSLSVEEERTYEGSYSINNIGQATSNGFDGQPGFALVDDNQDGTTDDPAERGWPGSDDKRTIAVTWTAADPKPFIKQGGFVLDAVMGQWYRIVQYRETGVSADIVVDRDLVPLPAGVDPQLVFYRGVLEVYPLGMRMMP